MNNIGLDGVLVLDLIRTVPENLAKPRHDLSPGDVLVCTTNSGALVGKCAYFDLKGRYAFSNHLTRLRPKHDVIDGRFLRWNLWLHWRRGLFDDKCKHWVNQSTLPKDALLEDEVLIPPLAEQRRIVAKLEALLGKVDASQQRLAKIPVLLKRFRQSVLAAACCGRLTADWREAKGVQGEWPTEPLSALFAMRNGKSLTAANRNDGEIPVYGGNGHMGNHDMANAEGQVIVIGRVGAQCGNVHFVSGKVWVTDNAISLEAKRHVHPAFYTFFLRSLNLNQLSAGTGQPYVSQEILGPIETPVISLSEQQEIVRQVESLFALAEQIEARFKNAKKQVDKLTPSLLARAFAGKLVPQDPADEPAAKLLERLGVARGA